MSADVLTPEEREKIRLRDEYEERAAILQFDAGYPRERAEAVARAQVYGAARQRAARGG